MEVRFFHEFSFSGLVGWAASIEDKIIPLLPNQPATKQEDLHKKPILTLAFCFIHHGEEIKVEIPVNVKGSPASLTEGA
jgi:hypothetical protein